MKTIHYTTTLFHYDGPQIFEARDAIGGHYVALLIEPQDGRECYLVVGVAPEKLRQFCSDMLDLRSLLIEVGKYKWYITTTAADVNRPIAIDPQNILIEESQFLPDDGFVLHDHPTDELARKETMERNDLIR